MTKEELELSKLKLEIGKLDAEIRAIEQKIDAEGNRVADEKKHTLREQWRSWVTLVVSFLTAASIAVVASIQVSGFLKQRQEEYDFNVTSTLITLVKDLDSTKEKERENAVILLSAYEEDAVPLLLNHLRYTKEPDAVIESLRLIQKNDNVDRAEFDGELRAAVGKALDLDPSSPDGLACVSNHLQAVRELVASGDAKVSILLSGFAKRVFVDKEYELPGLGKFALRDSLNEACQRVLGKDCAPEEEPAPDS